MPLRPTLPVLTLALLAVLAACPRAEAAESYDSCTGYIDSVPAVITSQGTWCMRSNLSTPQAIGKAIEIAANNVTLDCNGYKLGGLGAGEYTLAYGVWSNAANTVVQNCIVRGFSIGANMSGTNALVQDNLFEANTESGVTVRGSGIVRRNRILDTSRFEGSIHGIEVAGEVEIRDNVVQDVYTPDGVAHGVFVWNGHVVVVGNQFAGIGVGNTGDSGGFGSYGIWVQTAGTTAIVEGNHFQSDGGPGMAARCILATTIFRENRFFGFDEGFDASGCSDDGGNIVVAPAPAP